MGSSSSKNDDENKAGVPPKTEEKKDDDDDYQWPVNLYTELRDMAEVSFLIYFFAYLLNAARRGKPVEGEEGKEEAEVATMDLPELDELKEAVDEDSTVLTRTFTPLDVEKLIKAHESELTDNPNFPIAPAEMLASLAELKKRVPESEPRALTLRDFDDLYQQSELVYAIGRDDINKRITLVLRGTENQLAFQSNWLANLDVFKTEVPVPSVISNYVSFDKVYVHQGFYGFVMQQTQTKKDAQETTKYSQVLDALKESFADAGPGYKLYVTGHSLGAALSTVFAFLLAGEPEEAGIPKPVTCVNFASPRVGDGNFLCAVESLEKHKHLRMCRVINAGDSIAVVPSFNFYHVGFQVKLFETPSSENENEDPEEAPPPELSYPKVSDSWYSRLGRAWDNSILASLNLTYDHSSYRERVFSSSRALTAYDLNDLYRDEDLTGFRYIS